MTTFRAGDGIFSGAFVAVELSTWLRGDLRRRKTDDRRSKDGLAPGECWVASRTPWKPTAQRVGADQACGGITAHARYAHGCPEVRSHFVARGQRCPRCGRLTFQPSGQVRQCSDNECGVVGWLGEGPENSARRGSRCGFCEVGTMKHVVRVGPLEVYRCFTCSAVYLDAGE